MKKIAFLVRDVSKIGGAERVACNIANALVDYYEVYIISITHRFGEVPYELDSRIHCIFLNGDKNYRLRELVIYSWKKLRRILKNEAIDILFSMGSYSGLVGAIDTIALKTKIYFCDHGVLINEIKDKQITLARKIASFLSDYTVVLTKHSVNDYRKIFKTPEKKLIQIYNWVDDKVFEFAEPYDKSSNKIISVGRISEEKGFDMLVEVAKELKKLNSNWQWDVYGDGPQFDEIKEKIQEYGLENNVFLKGQENFIYDKYGGYAMLVSTSYTESFGLALVEAKANHLPIVSFDVLTGPAEIISNDENGFLIEAYDIKKMAQKINELLENKELRIEFSQNATKNLEKFDKQKILQQWIELIRNK